MSEVESKLNVVDVVAKKLGVTKKVAKAVVAAVTESISEVTMTEGRCQVWDFGTFKMTRREARRGHNPKTHEPIDIPASNQVSFSAARSLKERANA